MNKRKLHHLHKKLRLVSAWYFLAAAIIFFLIGIQGLRQNYRTMDSLRRTVVTADQEGGDTEKALGELRTFVASHMNTNLSSGPSPIKPPIQLKAHYERLMAAEKERVKQANAQLTSRAESACQGQFPGQGPNISRVTCVQDYIAQNAVKEREIPSELYKFDFKSPAWSPDKAGIGLLLSSIFTTLFVLRFATEWWLLNRIK